jgi:GNAT superfamily N-acetyltransferase
MQSVEIDTRGGTTSTAASAQPTLPCRYRLPDGRQVELDYIGPSDRADLLAGFQGLSARSRYLRFFSAMPRLPDFIADGLLRTDRANHVAIGARLLDARGQLLPPVVGVARYFRTGESEHIAEPAIAVVDDLHGLGLGKRLLRRLSAVARSNGVTRFRAQVLDSNRRVRTLLADANAQFVEQDDAGVLTYEIDIRKTVTAPRGVLARLLAAMLGNRTA